MSRAKARKTGRDNARLFPDEPERKEPGPLVSVRQVGLETLADPRMVLVSVGQGNLLSLVNAIRSHIPKTWQWGTKPTKDSSEEAKSAYGSLEFKVLTEGQFFIGPGATDPVYLQGPQPNFMDPLTPATIPSSTWAEGTSDAVILERMHAWVRAWLNKDKKKHTPFLLDQTWMAPQDNVRQIQAILVNRNNFAAHRSSAFWPSIMEVVDWLAGRPPTMDTWFLNRYVQQHINSLEQLVAYYRNEWDESELVVYPSYSPLFAVDEDPPADFHSDAWKLYRLMTASDRHMSYDFLHTDATEQETDDEVQRLLDTVQYLRDILAGRGEFDTDRFFLAMNDFQPLDPEDDIGWWYTETKRSWQRHKEGKMTAELSWGGKMAARHRPVYCLLAYIHLHYGPGLRRTIEPRNTIDDMYIHDKESIAVRLLEWHPAVRQMRTAVLMQKKMATPTLGTDQHGKLIRDLAELTISFTGKQKRVKLFKD